MRSRSYALGVACVAVFCSCGAGGGGDPTAACMSYCTALRTNGGGCGTDVENCATDCELWIKDSRDAGCPAAFDNLLSCTQGAGSNVCQSLGGACASEWSAWGACNKKCDVPGAVIFTPPGTAAAPCKSGTPLTIASDVALACSVRVIVDCAGVSATGYIPLGPPTASGSLVLSCTQASNCVIQVDAANRYLSGATGVSCTP